MGSLLSHPSLPSKVSVREGGLSCLSTQTHYRNYCRGQGGRTWQAFGRGKNGHETFRQARIYNIRDKCIVFARNLKFSNLTQ